MPYKTNDWMPRQWACLETRTPPFTGLGAFLRYRLQLRRIRKACPGTRQGRRKAQRQVMKLNRQGWDHYWRLAARKEARAHG